MAVKGFLDKHPHPTMDDVEKGLGGISAAAQRMWAPEGALEAAKEMRGGRNA